MEKKNISGVSPEKFAFVHSGERLHDKKFENKPVGYFKDAFIRFCKSKASVIAAIIILAIILYAFIAPILIPRSSTFMCGTYAKKPGRVAALAEMKWGFLDGGTNLTASEIGYIHLLGVGAAAADKDGKQSVSLGEAAENDFQPVIKVTGTKVQAIPNKKPVTYYNLRVDTYLRVGFIYDSVEQAEYARILQWQEETGIQVLYPLIDTENDFCLKKDDANYWYKTDSTGAPVDNNGNVLSYSEDLELYENYLRDSDGKLMYGAYTGGGNFDTAQIKIRVLYYNYYQYLYNTTPDYLLGTDAQGYDLALRIAGGIKLSLLIAVCVSVINFCLGACYGAICGYYGGLVDLILERITDILSGVPFVVVATLFQIHLAKKVGAIPSLLFAYVLTGWIGTASRVRTQFYRFKNQEYVMAARTLGAKDRRIIWKHIFPNTLGTIITSSALVIPGVILNESMLSYLGIIKLGTKEITSLGTLLSDAQGIWTDYPHLMIFPALVISLLMVCFNLFGNGLRDAFNPALRGVEE